MRRLLTVIALACLFAGDLAAQTPVGPTPTAKAQFLSSTGAPLAAGCLFTYQSGTTTPQATYTDSTGVSTNTNPVILDAAGRADVWVAGLAYRFKLVSAGGVNCASGVQQWQVDGVTSASFLNLANTWTALQTFGAVTVNGVAIFTGGIGGARIQFQQFTGNGTFTIPANVTAVKVTVVGAGGGGGGSDAGATFNGAGGGSGGSAVKWLTGLTPGNTLTVTVGTGGTASSGVAGGNGVASSVTSGTQVITTITANGGFGGASASGVLVGGGGAAVGTGGDVNSAGIPAALAAPIATMSNWGGPGAPSILGGGAATVFAGAGNAGTSAGSGGGGAGGGAARAGGAGANGIVIFEWVN